MRKTQAGANLFKHCDVFGWFLCITQIIEVVESKQSFCRCFRKQGPIVNHFLMRVKWYFSEFEAEAKLQKFPTTFLKLLNAREISRLFFGDPVSKAHSYTCLKQCITLQSHWSRWNSFVKRIKEISQFTPLITIWQKGTISKYFKTGKCFGLRLWIANSIGLSLLKCNLYFCFSNESVISSKCVLFIFVLSLLS